MLVSRAVEPVTLIAWSDYLCPWCFNASVRLHQLEDEFEGQVCLEWRSYLLRPRASARRDLERFRAYTRSWERPAAMHGPRACSYATMPIS